MKKKMLAFLLITSLVMLSACESNPDYDDYYDADDSPYAEDYDNSYDVDEEPEETENYGLTQEEARRTGGVYILRNKQFYPISTYQLFYSAGRINSLKDLGMTYAQDSDIPVFHISQGEQMVTFKSDSSYTFNRANFIGYCFPISVSSVNSDIEFGLAPILKCEYHETKFLDDVEMNSKESLESVLSKKGSYLFRDFITSDSPVSFTGGYYNRTDYIEYQIETNAKLYSFEENIEIPVQQTKLGYFILDTTGLSSGKYVINVGSIWPHKYVVIVE